ncbi:MAG TPA: PP2C family protein-serine/threonine phosphatase [Candidatus Salinicoccus stercoripullorum]|uniref:PP2C family protein-serine/threonine phosphatase n=1 Tax=Candidatus Salinicoccus stercoripullorum TaxID=2838756 RepID=A0A9D1U0T1_9STAP|nr:PP2C family protein-serine/threonine phosphatase [Candidatus Salinicoccus stercoripullorum]
MTYIDDLVNKYREMLNLYLYGEDIDKAFDLCHSFSEEVIEMDTSPEEVVSLHIDLLEDMKVEDGELVKKSLDILQEVIITFGFTYRDYKSMMNKLKIHDKEMDVASSLQETMLKAEIPTFETMEIGAISVPARKVSGDYFNIIDHNDGMLSFAVADVIGKGIPAAIAMTMIKFGMDSYGYSQLPSDSLKKLNRVVEKNVNQNMFVTMFYGLYDHNTNLLYYSSAGHEPALLYRYETDEFEEIDAKGIVLGVKDHARYEQKEIEIGNNDMIIVFTDGVTELRKHDDTFIDFEDVKDMIREVRDHHPQDIVQYIYESLMRMQNPHKKDDLTLFILKNNKE